MEWREAYQKMLEGNKIRRKGWVGYWYIRDGEVLIDFKNGIRRRYDELVTINLRGSQDILYNLEQMTYDDWEVV